MILLNQNLFKQTEIIMIPGQDLHTFGETLIPGGAGAGLHTLGGGVDMLHTLGGGESRLNTLSGEGVSRDGGTASTLWGGGGGE